MPYEGNTIYETIAELAQEVTCSIHAQGYELNDDAGASPEITETIIEKAVELEELLAECEDPAEDSLYESLIELTAQSVIAQLLITRAIRKAKADHIGDVAKMVQAAPAVKESVTAQTVLVGPKGVKQWQPIETAPTHQTVFIYAQAWGVPVLAKRLRDEWMVHVVSRVHRINLFEPFDYVPTHWMPIPVPPVKSEADSND